MQQQAGVTTAPAAQDVQAFAFADARQRFVDQPMHPWVVIGQGKGESPWGYLAEVVNLERALVTPANQEVSTDGIAQVRIRLTQLDGCQPGLGRAVQAQLRFGVQRSNGSGGQIMIDHGQAQAGEVRCAFQAVPLAGNDDREVVSVGGAEAKLSVSRLEGIGTAQQVDAALTQGGDRLVAAVVAPYLDGNAQLLGDNPGVIGAKAFVFVLTDVDFKRWIVGPRAAQYQVLAALQPLPVFAGQRQGGGGTGRACQQLAGLAAGQQIGRGE